MTTDRRPIQFKLYVMEGVRIATAQSQGVRGRRRATQAAPNASRTKPARARAGSPRRRSAP